MATFGGLVALGQARLGPRAALFDRITVSNEGRSGERAPTRLIEIEVSVAVLP
jgi:hypothetical protein